MDSKSSPAGMGADPGILHAHVEALEGERHFLRSPGRLSRAFDYIEAGFLESGWNPRRQHFELRGSSRFNVLALSEGASATEPRLLVGAHVDTVTGTPGADDNASGVAGLLEVARLLGAHSTRVPIELAAWDQEERTGLTYRVGSRRQVARAKREGVRYLGALVLEMIGYRTEEPGSQRVPLPVRWMDLSTTGDFLAVIADGQSKDLLRHFVDAAGRASPQLPLQTLAVPARGWPVLATRRSDNASFWSNGYPALMLTDTANLRNPHYHGPTDTADTLDYGFMAAVVDAVVEALVRYPSNTA